LLAQEFGVAHQAGQLDQSNYEAVLDPLLSAGDFLLNLSVGVSSLSLIQFAQRKGVLYLDTCIEPWEGGYTDPDKSLSERSNYALREAALQLRRESAQGLSTAVLTHGANPGLVSHLIKQALVNLAEDLGDTTPQPTTREEWAQLASRLNIRCIHIAERDSQFSSQHKIADEFVNTWSVRGLITEGLQPAELGRAPDPVERRVAAHRPRTMEASGDAPIERDERRVRDPRTREEAPEQEQAFRIAKRTRVEQP